MKRWLSVHNHNVIVVDISHHTIANLQIVGNRMQLILLQAVERLVFSININDGFCTRIAERSVSHTIAKFLKIIGIDILASCQTSRNIDRLFNDINLQLWAWSENRSSRVIYSLSAAICSVATLVISSATVCVFRFVCSSK